MTYMGAYLFGALVGLVFGYWIGSNAGKDAP
jgi:hypothetical protein